jgi:hypothetical protein
MNYEPLADNYELRFPEDFMFQLNNVQHFLATLAFPALPRNS